jgi:hypothetical protein
VRFLEFGIWAKVTGYFLLKGKFGVWAFTFRMCTIEILTFLKHSRMGWTTERGCAERSSYAFCVINLSVFGLSMVLLSTACDLRVSPTCRRYTNQPFVSSS